MTHHLPEPVARPAQVAYPAKAMLRTVVQILVGLAAAMPYLITELGFDKTWPIVVAVLGISAGVTRVMSIPGVNLLLGKYLGLGATPSIPPRYISSEENDH